MSQHTRQPHDATDPGLPDSLASDLKSLFPGSEIPAAIDQKILQRGHRTMQGWHRRRWYIGLASSAVAACLILGIGMVTWHRAEHPTSVAQVQIMNPHDLNADGQVDIVDALVLAKRVQRHEARPENDLNHDGLVTASDADELASTIVRLQGGVSR